LSLSWCKQDSDLLLSSGKDNRSICWNPQTGEMLGEFPVVTNWTFKTTFHPRNPSYIATASYDGKIAVRTLQNTNPQVDTGAAAATDDDDFFSRASNAQTSSFTLKQTPNWLKRPVGATFGFGGKLVSFTHSAAHQSKVNISTIAIDSGVSSATERFEKAVQEGNLVTICEEKTQDAKSEAERAEWKILKALFDSDTKAKLVEHLGFKAEDISTPEPEKDEAAKDAEDTTGKNRLSSFFADGDDSENFLASLSIQSTQTARTNNPFQIYTGQETEADKAITKAVVLGEYDRAVDVCLKEDRISDAFMLAICGGDKCIDKVKAAYFTKKHNGPNYLRLLASVVGKNMWDVVHNADIANWKEVMVALCTHASDEEFTDLCEALGDRLEEEFQSKNESELRRAASLCYLAGSKLHKVVNIWISELHEDEKAGLQQQTEDSTFSVHARSLQNFIEKVTVFREAVKFVDDEKSLSSGWKLNPLYERYCEYADIVSSHGQLNIAGKYLDLLPAEYPAAMVARNRIKQATTATAAVPAARKPAVQRQPFQPAQPTAPLNAYPPATTAPVTTNPYMPPAPAQALNSNYPQQGGYKPGPYPPAVQSTYQPTTTAPTSIYNQYNNGPSTFTPAGVSQPPRQFAPPPSAPPKAGTTANWNDTPEVVRPARRNTPAAPPQAVPLPFPGAPPTHSPAQTGLPWGVPPPRATPPPPPKGAAPPNRVQSPALQQHRPASPAVVGSGYPPVGQNAYAPPPPQGAGAGGRYTPQPASQTPMGAPPSRAGPPPPQGSVVPGPPSAGPRYAPPPTTFGQPHAPSQYAPQPPPQAAPSPYAPAPGQQVPPPQSMVQGPPPMGPGSQQISAPPPPKPATPTPQPSKHRKHLSYPPS
jgi:protein transport protein SEC31